MAAADELGASSQMKLTPIDQRQKLPWLMAATSGAG